MAIDLESVLQPVSAEAPCGADLEYDLAFLELERLSESKPERQMGNTIVPAQEPDWKEVGDRALALLGKTKDLRVAAKLARALLYTEAWLGFAQSLALVRGLVEKFWNGLYPKLDPAEGNDPTFRVNILMGLCDPATFLDRIRVTPIVSSRSFGRFSLRDIAVATGEVPAPAGTEPPALEAIEGAFSECPLGELQATAQALGSAIGSLEAIEAVVSGHVGAASGTNFAKLVELLRSGQKIMSAQLLRLGAGGPEAAGAAGGDTEAALATASVGVAMTGDVRSREDVVRLLDKICAYYARAEPSSPIPLLLQRSKRLVSANFLDIVRDIAPDGLTQVENLSGKATDKSS